MAIYRGPGGSGDATDDAASAAELIIQKTAEAAAYSTSAASSATSAAASATSAAASASGVAGYAAAAAASAADALESETNAATSETNASASAADAADDAATATTQATSASASASSASTSASNAASSASNAATSASNAAASASSAASSASSASTSASNASISASNAASSATTAAGYVPSLTGNTGKYLRTNGTSTYWDTVTDVNAATPTNDGLVFGETDATAPSWSGTINNYNLTYPSGYYELVNCGTQAILFLANSSPFAAACYAGQVVAGQQISINDGTSTLNFGTVVSINTSGGQPVVTTSISGWGAIGVTLKYIYQVTLIGTIGGNVALGHGVLPNISVGSYNTVLGFSAGSHIVNGANNILIGNGADVASDVSNEAVIGSSVITTTRLYGALAVGGSSVGTSGQVLISNGSGSAPSWSTPSSGTVTSVALTAPTGLTVSGSPITSSGTLALSLTAGYSIPTTSSQTNWDTAYGWGNHASAGYLTSATAASTYAPLTGTGASGTWGISISGNAATVSNGLYSTGSYADPTWLTTVAGSKITGTINGGTY